MQRRHNQTGDALGWNLCFQQAGGKIRLRALCCPLFDITLSLLRESPDCSSLRASNRHRRSIKLILPILLAFSPWEGFPCWSRCGRRTRPFSGRAFREHRTNVGALPIFFIVRIPFASPPPRQGTQDVSDCAHSTRAFCEARVRLGAPGVGG